MKSRQICENRVKFAFFYLRWYIKAETTYCTSLSGDCAHIQQAFIQFRIVATMPGEFEGTQLAPVRG